MHKILRSDYRVRAISRIPEGWVVVLHGLDDAGKARCQERITWRCPGEPRPKLRAGGVYTKLEVLSSVGPRCTDVESLVETISE